MELTYEEFINNILETRGRFACGDEYHERHHIVPRCMGGTDEEENLIDLFAREHFIAHKLLAEEHPDNTKLVYAWGTMAYVKRDYQERCELTPEEYEEVKIAVSRARKAYLSNPENNPMFGKHLSQEAINKIREKNKGKFVSEESRKKQSISAKARCTEEFCQKMRELHTGTHLSTETKQKISAATSGENNPMFGISPQERMNEDTYILWCRHLSESLSGGNNPKAKQVIRLCDSVVYDYLNKAAQENNVHKDTMRKYCRQHNGFMYYDEWLEQQNNLVGDRIEQDTKSEN